MVWVKLDDGFADHPKIVAAGPIAACVQVRALCYAARHLTDGFIPFGAVSGLCGGFKGIGIETGQVGGGSGGKPIAAFGVDADDEDWAAILVQHGLWDDAPGGYQIHDYLEYNRSRADVIADREQKKASGIKGGKASAQARGQARGQASASRVVGGSLQEDPRNLPKRNATPVPVPLDQKERDAREGPTPTPELWSNPDLRYVAAQRIWSDTCQRAGRPWHGMPTGSDRAALATIAAHAAAVGGASPGDVACRALETFSADATQEPYGWALPWCAQHVAVYASGRTPPRKGETPQGDPRVESLRAQLRDLGTMDLAKSAKLRAELAAVRKATGT